MRRQTFNSAGPGSSGLSFFRDIFGGNTGRLKRDVTVAATTVGVVVIGAALLEFALIPGIVIGGAAVMAPSLLRKSKKTAAAERSLNSSLGRLPVIPDPVATVSKIAGELSVKQAVLKTITFRVIVTALDFTTNLLVLREPTTAAGLSGFALVAGPFFYFVHETAWNYLGPKKVGPARAQDNSITIPMFVVFSRQDGPKSTGNSLTISRALAKTITFRIMATTADFTVTYLVVGNLATTLTLISFGLVLGPFVYWGHEKAWELIAARNEQELAPTKQPTMLLAPPQGSEL